MKRSTTSSLVGLVLICAGVLFLLQNFGLAHYVGGVIWALLFAVGGLVFLAAFVLNHDNWWAIIPGLTLLGLSALIGVSTVFPALAGPAASLLFAAIGLSFLVIYATHRDFWWALIPGFTLLGLSALVFVSTLFPALAGPAASLFLAGIGLSFWAVYATNSERWWAIIPGGTMLTLAFIVAFTAFPGLSEGRWVPSILFLGLAATFGLLYLLPTPQNHPVWALWPASVLAIMGLLMTAFFGQMAGILWPLILIAAGAVVLLRTMQRRVE